MVQCLKLVKALSGLKQLNFKTMLKLLKLSVFMSLLGLFSCGNNTGNFWKNYKKELLVENISDQGGWGGHRALYWQAETGEFTEEEILAKAKENGWKMSEKTTVQEVQLKKWVYQNKPVFPLSHAGFNINVSSSSSTYENFPRWINSNLTVYSFKTGILAIVPGTDETLEVNGFVLISQDNKEMSVYHLWGE